MIDHARSQPTHRFPRAARRRRHFAVAGLMVAAAIAVVVWLIVRDSGSASPQPVAQPSAKAAPITVAGLRTLGSIGIPIYWAGVRRGYHLELTKTNTGSVYIRYLPSGVQVGSQNQYLTIGTYPMKRAFAVTKRLAAGDTSVPVGVKHGGVGFYSRARSVSVFFAYPRSAYQVEVFSPTAGEALRLVESGRVGLVR